MPKTTRSHLYSLLPMLPLRRTIYSGVLKAWTLRELKQWHNSSPVSTYERMRNNEVYNKYQENRNPFIDHPEWVEQIFGA